MVPSVSAITRVRELAVFASDFKWLGKDNKNYNGTYSQKTSSRGISVCVMTGFVIISTLGHLSTAAFLFTTFCFSDISYHMTIKTGDKPNAGTDANVYFALHGDKGETPRIALQDESQTFRRFERGRADKFVVQTADVGKVGH